MNQNIFLFLKIWLSNVFDGQLVKIFSVNSQGLHNGFIGIFICQWKQYNTKM